MNTNKAWQQANHAYYTGQAIDEALCHSCGDLRNAEDITDGMCPECHHCNTPVINREAGCEDSAGHVLCPECLEAWLARRQS